MTTKRLLNIGTDQQQQIDEELKKHKVVFALVFGSTAKQKTHKNSDIDFAIYLKEKDPIKRNKTKFYLISKLASIIKKDTDVIILNDIRDNFLLLNIIKEGKVILGKETIEYFHLRTKKLHQVIDFIQNIKHVYKETGNFGKN